jgi:hypothetical protein
MKILGSLIITSAKGEHVLIMLSKELTERDRLHHYLAIDAFEFKKNIAEQMPEIKHLSKGILSTTGELEWSEDYIELPKYDLN